MVVKDAGGCHLIDLQGNDLIGSKAVGIVEWCFLEKKYFYFQDEKGFHEVPLKEEVENIENYNMKKNKNTHGGARKGAGRKKKNNIKINLSTPLEVLNKIDAVLSAKERNERINIFLKELSEEVSLTNKTQ